MTARANRGWAESAGKKREDDDNSGRGEGPGGYNTDGAGEGRNKKREKKTATHECALDVSREEEEGVGRNKVRE